MTTPRPPDEVFCMTCGPDAALDRDPLAPVLRCARCGAGERVPALPLFVVTGASGVGKTTVTEPLRRLLPDCAVFEVDLTLQVAALGWEIWRDTWLRVAYGEALHGRVTVLCGSLMPDQLDAVPARKLLGPIHFCDLDCPDDVLAARLRARPPVLAAQLAGDRDRGAPAFRRVAPHAHPAVLRHQRADTRGDGRADRRLGPAPASRRSDGRTGVIWLRSPANAAASTRLCLEPTGRR
jgi:hypothetical protein